MCQQKLPSNQRKLETNDDPDGKKYYIAMSEDESITILSWCFEEDKVKLYVETSHLSQVQFKDNVEITEALKNAPRHHKKWILNKSN